MASACSITTWSSCRATPRSSSRNRLSRNRLSPTRPHPRRRPQRDADDVAARPAARPAARARRSGSFAPRRRWSCGTPPEIVSALGIGALCLSTALPVAATPYRDSKPGTPQPRRAVEFWAEGLLPEGETRTTLERRFEIRRGDTIGLLAAIGADCAGAVSVVTDTAVRPSAPGRPRALTEQQLSEAVEAPPSVPLGVGDRVRVSLGGMQAKLPLVRTEHGWAQPVDGQPSTHILKPDPTDTGRPGLVAAGR